jgi:2-dehydropantoate 2-reductase
MKILIVGAGAIGGYFGGRMLQAGRDVTFLVRPIRAKRLSETGLVIKSGAGDVTLPAPPMIQAPALRDPFDLVIVSCKAYGLEKAIQDFAPAVGPQTVILPMLNGMRHLDMLDQRFGPGHAIGGVSLISSALDGDGRILHLNPMHAVVFGERDGSRTARIEAIAAALSGCKFEARLSESILQEMWEKWVFIATTAGITCLMRGAVGDIVAAGATGFTLSLLQECAGIAARRGFAPREPVLEADRTMLTKPGSPLKASMARDIERHAPIEAEHIIGDLLRQSGQEPSAHPMLRIAYAHLKTYEATLSHR